MLFEKRMTQLTWVILSMPLTDKRSLKLLLADKRKANALEIA